MPSIAIWLSRRRFAFFTLSVMLLSVFTTFNAPSAHATTQNFNHIVIIALENELYNATIGTGQGTSNDRFISSMIPYSTVLDLNSYGSISGCSAGCYAAFTSGTSSGVSDQCQNGGGSTCPARPTFGDSLS